jgi:sugar phosphate isomerase/epimerase
MHLALAVQTPDVSLSLPVALLSGTWSDKVEKAAQLGVDGLELMTADPGRLDASEIRGTLEARGLSVVAIGSGAAAMQAGLTLLHADEALAARAATRLDELIDFAAAVGAPLVTNGAPTAAAKSISSILPPRSGRRWSPSEVFAASSPGSAPEGVPIWSACCVAPPSMPRQPVSVWPSSRSIATRPT